MIRPTADVFLYVHNLFHASQIDKIKFKGMPSSELCIECVSCLMVDSEACRCEHTCSAYIKALTVIDAYEE